MHDFAILYVEDEPSDVVFLKRAFAAAGIKNRLLIAINGQQAIDYLSGSGSFADREQFPLPGLVLLDLKLPQRSGLAVLKWIREQPKFKHLLVVIYTSSDQPKDIESAYELGANAYLIKHGNPSQLAAMVNALRDFWLIYNEPPNLAK